MPICVYHRGERARWDAGGFSGNHIGANGLTSTGETGGADMGTCWRNAITLHLNDTYSTNSLAAYVLFVVFDLSLPANLRSLL